MPVFEDAIRQGVIQEAHMVTFLNIPLNKKLEIISTAKLIAKIIDNLHNGKSVTELWHNGD